jgi:hypothetical protein
MSAFSGALCTQLTFVTVMQKRPGTAGGKPPQGAATVQPLPPSKALKMIEAAHDIAQPIQSIQSLNSTLSEMGSGIGSGIVSKPVPAVAAEQESGAGDMSAELTVQETPALCVAICMPLFLCSN